MFDITAVDQGLEQYYQSMIPPIGYGTSGANDVAMENISSDIQSVRAAIDLLESDQKNASLSQEQHHSLSQAAQVTETILSLEGNESFRETFQSLLQQCQQRLQPSVKASRHTMYAAPESALTVSNSEEAIAAYHS